MHPKHFTINLTQQTLNVVLTHIFEKAVNDTFKVNIILVPKKKCRMEDKKIKNIIKMLQKLSDQKNLAPKLRQS